MSKTQLNTYIEDLVKQKTVSGDEEETKEFLGRLDVHFRSAGLFVQNYEQNGFHSLIATTKETQKPKILLAAHVDVVSGSEHVFMPYVKDGKMYGRGTNDMKFAIASYMLLIDELGDTIKDLDFGIMLTSDEEIGGTDGVEMLLSHGYRSEIVILPDGANNLDIEEKAKGLWNVRIESRGKSAHGSQPWEGESALSKLIEVIQEFEGKFGAQSSDTATCTISNMSGGDSANKVPDYAEATADVRFNDSAQLDQIKSWLKESCSKHDKVAFEEVLHGHPVILDKDNAYVQSFADQIKKVTGSPVSFTTSNGASDARFFAAKDIQVIITRPKSGGAHSEDEWIDLAQTEQFYAALKAFVVKEAKV